jgi:uncharacterized membrane protein
MLQGGSNMAESHSASSSTDPIAIEAAAPAAHAAPDDGALLSLYREEVAQALSFRRALELTRNLSIAIVAGMALVVFGLPEASHLVLFLGSLSVFALALIEARSHRFAEVREQRVRAIERNYFAPGLDPSLVPEPGWREELARGLARFTLQVSFLEAFAVRIKQNYFLIFIALDACWFSKLYLYPAPALSFHEFVQRADLGLVPGLLVLSVVVPVWGSYIGLIVWLIGKQSGREQSY